MHAFGARMQLRRERWQVAEKKETSGRVTLVTGASRGIGLECARRLADAGHQVVGFARAPMRGEFPGLLVEVDAQDRSAVAACVSRLAGEFAFNGLVNNVGMVVPQGLDDITLDAYDRTFEVNVTTALLCAQALAPSMRAQGFGRIVNISSEVVLGLRLRTAYSAAKAALLSFTRTWALELARDGITVNAVAPGPVETDFFNANNPVGSAERQRKVDRTPIGRIAAPSDIANAVSFFMQAESGFVTGQCLHVDGGSSIGSSAFA